MKYFLKVYSLFVKFSILLHVHVALHGHTLLVVVFLERSETFQTGGTGTIITGTRCKLLHLVPVIIVPVPPVWKVSDLSRKTTTKSV